MSCLPDGEVYDFIWKFLKNKKIFHPDRRKAGFNLAKHYAKKIIQREVSPYQGAKWIWHRIENEYEYEYEGEFDQLLTFVGLASEYEDFNDEVNKDFYGEDGAKQKQQEIEDSIIAEASQLLSIN